MPNKSILPGHYQLASRTGHVRSVLEAIAEKKDFFVPADQIEPLDWLESRLTTSEAIGANEFSPTIVVGVDGSSATVEARAGMPSVRYGYVQTAAVLLYLDHYKEQQAARFVDPVALARTHESSLVELDFPTAGAYIREGVGVVESWRESVFSLFKSRRISLSNVEISLLDQLFEVHGTPDNPAQALTVARCPVCGARDVRVSKDPTPCTDCGYTVYATDVLRLAEEVNDYSSNETALGRLMQVVELLTLTAIIRLFWTRGRSLLSEIVFIADGPLAVFGTPAKLKTQILSYLQSMRTQNGSMPYVCGIEKSGEFVDFAENIAYFAEDRLKPGTLITVDDVVIQKIKNSPDVSDYGQETYFGRKFFYYSKDRSMLVLTVAPDHGQPYGANVGQPDPSSYQALAAILRTIDMTGSAMYRDAIVPVALAHHAAAYPVGVGTDVLRLAAREVLGLDGSEHRQSRHATG